MSALLYPDHYGECGCGKQAELHGECDIINPEGDEPRKYTERWDCECGATWDEVFVYEGSEQR